MTHLFLLLFSISSIVISAQVKTISKELSKKIAGHWILTSKSDSILLVDELLNEGKPVTFKGVKYKEELYYWGGGAYTGLEFTNNGEFGFFNNVMCSTESSPQNYSAAWTSSEKDNTCTIRNSETTFFIKILSVNKTEMCLIFSRSLN
jgi:hypothetical protein